MKKCLLVFAIFSLLCGAAFAVELTLNSVIEQSAKEIAGKLAKDTRIAIVSFESESDNVSDYIMEELIYCFTESNLEVADRSNLPYIRIELIRNNIDKAYMQDNGFLMLLIGPSSNSIEYKHIPLYRNNEKYHSLKTFCTERKNRDLFYGVSDKYIEEYNL